MFISVMITPLLVYVVMIPTVNTSRILATDAYVLLFSNALWLGRIIAIAGIVILLISFGQWHKYRSAKMGLFNKGLYAKVRHPQFTGIITIMLGLTVMVLISGCSSLSGPLLDDSSLTLMELVGLWFLQALGYAGIAMYEERQLSKKFLEYNQYKEKVSFLFPIKKLYVPEFVITLIVLLVICSILLVLPYDAIRVFSIRYFPSLPLN